LIRLAPLKRCPPLSRIAPVVSPVEFSVGEPVARSLIPIRMMERRLAFLFTSLASSLTAVAAPVDREVEILENILEIRNDVG